MFFFVVVIPGVFHRSYSNTHAYLGSAYASKRPIYLAREILVFIGTSLVTTALVKETYDMAKETYDMAKETY